MCPVVVPAMEGSSSYGTLIRIGWSLSRLFELERASWSGALT
jgi:hypothetical protein